jgi:hypothetical protein
MASRNMAGERPFASDIRLCRFRVMPIRFRLPALAAALAICTLAGLGACSDATPPINGNQIKPDPLAVGSWDLDRARADLNSTLPFACEKAADKTSWPCIPNAVVDTIMSGIVLLDAQGTYGVVITHRVILNGTTQVITRVLDENNFENESGTRTGTWGRSAMRIVLYPQSITTPSKYGDLTDTSFVHGQTRMSVAGASFILR